MSFLFRGIKMVKEKGFVGIWQRMKVYLRLILLRISQALGHSYAKSAYGLRFAANYSDKTFEFYVTGSYGFFYWDRLLTINHPFVFLDIGSNQGLYAIGATKNPHLISSYAFEPVVETYNYLLKNIEINDSKHKCIAINKAIADRCGVAKIATKAGHSGVASLAATNNLLNDEAIDEVELIAAADLDNIVLVDDVPIVVKIDVEGYEPIVLEQLLKTQFIDRISEIFFEVDEQWVDVQSIETVLREIGFVNFCKVGSGTHYDVLASREIV